MPELYCEGFKELLPRSKVYQTSLRQNKDIVSYDH